MNRKLYVSSGQLNCIIMADNPLNAALKALKLFGHKKTLDSTFFLIDERGYRDKYDAAWAIPIRIVLKAGGFVIEQNL